MSLNLRSSGTPLTQNELDNNLTFLYSRDITGSTVTGTTLFLYKQDGTVLSTQLPSNSGGTGIDTFTTGFTYSNNNLTISRNQGQPPLNVTINNFTGLTINGSISASTYLGLPQTVPGSPVNSIQFNGGSGVFSGSSNFTFNPSTNLVSLIGNLSITGSSSSLSNTTNGGVTNFISNNSSSYLAYSANGLIAGRGGSSISAAKFLFTTGYTNGYIRNTELTTVETVGTVAGGSRNSSIPTKQINFIASQNSGSVFEWHYNTLNQLTNAGTAKMILSASTGDLFTSGSYSTTALTLRNTPTLNNSGTQFLVRNSSTGDIEYRDASTISGGTGIDTFTTGFTYSNNNLTISRNQGQPPLNVTINNFTGLTVNGSLSASTYLGLPQFVTGGTYSAGTLSLLTNGNVVNVTGFSKTINVETIEWEDEQTIDYTKKSGIDDPVIFFDSSNNSFDSPSSITVTLDPNLSYTSSDVGKRNWKMIFPSIQRVEDGNTWIVKQGGSGVTSVNLVEYKAGRVTPHVLEFWWDPNFSGGRYRIAKYELEEAENDATTVDPAIGLNFYSKIKFAGQIWGGASYGNSGGSTIIPAGAIIYVKDVIILNQGTITPTGATITIGLSKVSNAGSLGSSLTTSTPLSDFGVPSNNSLAIFKNSRPASYYNSGSGGVGNANMFFVDNTIGAVRTSVPVMITLSAASLTDGVIQVYVPYMVIQPRLLGTPYTLIDNTYDLWVTESNWSALNSGGTSTTIIQQLTGNTSASCISNLYVSNIYGCSPITIHDSIKSVGSTASGLLSTALGSGTQAIGNYSHAEGINTQAIGDYSHAEGEYTIARGITSHAEGSGTTAIGNYSHAEGRFTIASGNTSHAEGFFTQANGITSHAEGNRTIAADYSHAEGLSTKALGVYSHAEGHSSIASGAGSHAQNFFTVASGQFSHAEGRSSRATGFTSHAEGFFTLAANSHSHAEGEYTIARGITSHAEGSGTTAIGNYSHAEGRFTIASGNTSHAEGYRSIANGLYSHSEGNSSNATGIGSHAEGNTTEAQGDYSHAEGASSSAVGNYSHAEGNSIANGESSHSEGGGTSADGDYSHSEGSGTVATGIASHSEGGSAQAIGDYSHAEGESAIATGLGSHAEGSSTNAIGEASHAEGASSQSSGDYSHAEGRSTESNGEASHSEGNRSVADGNYSHAGGYQSYTLNYGEFARSSSNGGTLYGQNGIFTMYGITNSPGAGSMSFGDGTIDILLIDDSAYRFDIKGVAISQTGALASFDGSLTLKKESGVVTFCPSGNSQSITSVCGDMTGATISLLTASGTTFRARYTSTVTGNTTLNATFNYTQVYNNYK